MHLLERGTWRGNTNRGWRIVKVDCRSCAFIWVALTWGTVWSASGTLLALDHIFLGSTPLDLDARDTLSLASFTALLFGICVMLAGSAFAALLSLTEQKNLFLGVSGITLAIGGLAVGVLATLSAMATVRLAQRAHASVARDSVIAG